MKYRHGYKPRVCIFLFCLFCSSYDVLAGKPHNSKLHCWLSFSQHKNEICRFYSTHKAQGSWLLWGNILIPTQYLFDSWGPERQRAYLYAIFRNNPAQPVIYDYRGIIFNRHSPFTITPISMESAIDYSHHDLFFYPFAEGVPEQFPPHWAAPSFGASNGALLQETETVDCTLDSSGHTEPLILQCWYEGKNERNNEIEPDHLQDPMKLRRIQPGKDLSGCCSIL